MTETSKKHSFSARLRRLPGQLLLALVNATAVLVIAAGIVVILAFNAVNQSAERVAGSVTKAVASEIKIQPQQLLDSIDSLNAELSAYLAASKQERSERADRLETSITSLAKATSQLNDTLSQQTVRLTDEAIRSATDALTDSLLRLRRCQPGQS